MVIRFKVLSGRGLVVVDHRGHREHREGKEFGNS